jgi:hypothetical protein
MCAYVFLSEPPPPRTIRRAVAEAAQEVSLQADEVMECVVEALTAFPDAYRAVVRLMKERRARRAEPQRSP